jgi:hypothetical protein
MDVIVVCHTEFGFIRNKKLIGDKKITSGVTDGVKNLIKLADRYNAKITFAVCPEVVEYFPQNVKHEIGLHIHPGWTEFNQEGFKYIVGDSYLKKKCKQSINSSVLRDYSYEEQFEMIKTGKEYIKERFGLEPKSFVAGRWSLNNDTIRALVKNGITHDCSATAHSKPLHHNWSELPRICMPYHPNEGNYQQRGEVPLLIVPISKYFRNGGVNPEIATNVGVSWLKACFSEYYNQGVPLFHICLHSPSMTDDYLTSAMECLISFISKHRNINFRFVSEIREYPFQKYKTNIFPYFFAINKNIIKTVLKKYL